MNNTFLERLNNNQLTNVDQYRKMRKATLESSATAEAPDAEEWKTWNLAPVSAGAYSQPEKDDAPKSAAHLHRAMRKV